MKALLLSAGLGTRLYPITATLPKCLVPIHGKPLIDFWLEMLIPQGVSPILVNIHHFAEKVREHLKNSRFHESLHLVYEKELRGTGGTLLDHQSFFGDEPLMLIHGDNLSKFDVNEFCQSHINRPKQCLLTMMVFTTDTPSSCGIVELDPSGIVQGFHEKVPNPPGTLANAAVYILEPSIFPFLRSLNKGFIDFSTDVLPHFIGQINTFKNSLYHRDIGTPESLKRALTEFPPAKGG